VEIVNRLGKPALIGIVAVQLGWWATLDETEALLDDLVREGLLRRLTPDEEKACCMRHAYVLADVDKAHKMVY
jgi:hypothetical protein